MSNSISDAEWQDYFYYDESSPSCLRWNVSVWAGKYLSILKSPIDSVAGSLSKRDGYWRVCLKGKSYLVHRIVMYLLTKEMPDCVDHINGVRSDNQIENLRNVDNTLNVRNMSQYDNNTSGKCGVKLKRTCAKGKYYDNWEACVETPAGRKSKAFSINKYGNDLAFKLACEWRDAKIDELNAQGAGYTVRHGI